MRKTRLCALILFLAASLRAADAPKETVAEKFAKRAARLWSLQPVVKPAVPVGASVSKNPIDSFIGAMYKEKGLHPVAKADKLTLLRRVYFDLIGIPPTVAEQEGFLHDMKRSWTVCSPMTSTEFAGAGIGSMFCATRI
jgi:hypothetical protein